ncbi:MAG: hypothetical protein AAGI50_04805 [Pseudomonadota bacterium]
MSIVLGAPLTLYAILLALPPRIAAVGFVAATAGALWWAADLATSPPADGPVGDALGWYFVSVTIAMTASAGLVRSLRAHPSVPRAVRLAAMALLPLLAWVIALGTSG